MALDNCKECKAEISDLAEVCPKCGIPAPTTVYSKEFPKCVIDGCNNLANTLSKKKYRGMCTEHYTQDLDRSSIIWWGIFVLAVIGISMLF